MKVMISESAVAKDPKLAALKDKVKEANAAYKKAQAANLAAGRAEEKAGIAAEKAENALDAYMTKMGISKPSEKTVKVDVEKVDVEKVEFDRKVESLIKKRKDLGKRLKAALAQEKDPYYKENPSAAQWSVSGAKAAIKKVEAELKNLGIKP